MKNSILIKTCLLVFAIALNLNLFSQWTQIGNIITSSGSNSGNDVELSGDGSTFVVGNPFDQSNGSATVFYKTASSTWEQLGDKLVGDDASDRLGYSVAINVDGTVIAVSSPGVDNPTIEVGKVQVFTLISNNWVQKGSDILTSGGYEFGWGIDIDELGNTVAITSIGDLGGDVVYVWSGSEWIQQGQLFVENGDFSPFSTSLSGDGSHVAFGSPNLFGLVNHPGSVYVYTWNGVEWELLGNPITAALQYNDFGKTVSISDSGEQVAIGIPDLRDEDNDAKGGVVVYFFDGLDWVQRGSIVFGENEYDEFGTDVKLSADGNTLLASGIKHDNSSGSNSGHVRSYFWNGSDWEQKGEEIIGSDWNSEFGYSLGMSNDGDRIVSISSGLNEIKIFDWEEVSTSDEVTSNYFSYGPNPTLDYVEFYSDQEIEISDLKVYDIMGNIFSISSTLNNSRIELPNLSGLYFIEFLVSGKTQTVQIIKH